MAPAGAVAKGVAFLFRVTTCHLSVQVTMVRFTLCISLRSKEVASHHAEPRSSPQRDCRENLGFSRPEAQGTRGFREAFLERGVREHCFPVTAVEGHDRTLRPDPPSALLGEAKKPNESIATERPRGLLKEPNAPHQPPATRPARARTSTGRAGPTLGRGRRLTFRGTQAKASDARARGAHGRERDAAALMK